MRGDQEHKKMEEIWQLLRYSFSQPAKGKYKLQRTIMTDLKQLFVLLPGAAQENKSKQAC